MTPFNITYKLQRKKLLIIVTSSYEKFIKQLRIHTSFNATCKVPSLLDASHIVAVAQGSSYGFDAEEAEELKMALYGKLHPGFKMGVKKVLELVASVGNVPRGERVKALVRAVRESQAEERENGSFMNMYV